MAKKRVKKRRPATRRRPQEDEAFAGSPAGAGGDGLWLAVRNRVSEFLDAAPVVIGRGVNRVLRFFLRGSRVQREQQILLPIVRRINELEAEVIRLDDRELRERTDDFRRRVQEGGESLDDILPEAFAVAREACDRRIGMCSVFKPEHGFDPAQLTEANRAVFDQARQQLDGGASVAELMLPASFYAGIRALYPDYRPPFRMRPFDVQLIGGIVLHQGKIAEMVTGEGKTLVATLPAYLNALSGAHVHVVTVNDYLARRDRDWNAPMFESLGLTVGAIQSDMDPGDRQPQYACNVTYGTNNEFGFDYLRDNMKDSLEAQAQGPLQYAIIDEVDSILVDEARTPLIISGPAEDSSDRYHTANRLVSTLAGINAQRLPRDEEERERVLARYDYTYNPKDHSTALTERGIQTAQRFLQVDNLYQGRNMEWPPYIEAALKAKELYKLDVDYVIRDGEVIIVDEFTGRLMPGRRWSDGLHQAVEAKEANRGARIKEENQTLATITFQNFFRLYDKIAGMTGTAMTEAGEFMKIYKLDVVPIPTNRPLRRAEHNDLIFGTEDEKWGAIVEEIAEVHRQGRPILVGTISIEKSEHLGALLERRGVKHEVLNAKQHEREAGIVSLAGQFGAVTVSTNMAGRGTDIVLGQCPWQDVFRQWQAMDLAPRDWSPDHVRKELRGQQAEVTDEDVRWELQRRLERYWLDAWGLRQPNENDLADDEVHARLERFWAERGRAPYVLANSVAELGGLHVVGTERHEARRIDNQLRGRAGRQGDPGSSRFFVSLEDDLMRIFMAEWVRNFMLRAGLSDGEPIEAPMVSRAIARAQRKVEEHNYEIRKNLLEYDEVMDEQRKLIYDQRQEVLEGGEHVGHEELIARGIARFLAPDLQPPSEALPERVFALLAAQAEAVGVSITMGEWLEADHKGLAAALARSAEEPLRHGLDAGRAHAWAAQLVADCRADGDAYPEQWQLGRLQRWGKRLGIECRGAVLAAVARRELAGVVADAARRQAEEQGTSREALLEQWFAVGYEQDRPLLAPAPRWELGAFRDWIGRLGVSIQVTEWSAATSTCQALLPQWLEAAGERFAGMSAPELAGELARCAAELYLGSGMFGRRPSAERVALWASRRLGIGMRPEAVRDAYDERVEPALVEAVAELLAERLDGMAGRDQRDLWAASVADWHLQMHLRCRDHNIIGLATYLSPRLRMGIRSFDLARRPAGDMPAYLLGLVAEQGEMGEEEERLDGLEDIAFHMVDGSLARLADQTIGGRAAAAPAERHFVPLSEWAAELGLAISEAEWRAYDLHELHLHVLREAERAYPAASSAELCETFVPRFLGGAVARFLDSEVFAEAPSYGMLAAWACSRYSFASRETQVEAQLKRFAEDHLGAVRDDLVKAKLEEYEHGQVEVDEACEGLVVATLETYQAFGDSDEMDFGGLAEFARRVFDVSVPVGELEEEAEGDEREAVVILADRAKGHYARRGLDSLVTRAVEGALGLCMPAERFPSEWQCDYLRRWLQATGLSPMLESESVREETVAEVRAYFTRAAAAFYAERPPEAVRVELVRASLRGFLESNLSAEGRNVLALANTVANKYGVEPQPFELSKLTVEEAEARLRERIEAAYEARKAQLGTRRLLWTIRMLLLQTIDTKWKDHLYNMDHLRGTIGFRGYGQKDPKVEYKREGYDMFDHMTQSIEDTVTDYLLKVQFDLDEGAVRSIWRASSYTHEDASAAAYEAQQRAYEEQQRVAESPMDGPPAPKPIAAAKEPGRNDPCPCGSGRKYKKCCGRRGA